MTLRNKKRLLCVATAAILATSAAVVAAGVAHDRRLPESNGPAPIVARVSDRATATPAPRALSKEDFEPHWNRPLRKPLFDPPPPPPPVVEKPPPRPITAKLLATMIEPGSSVAMLQLANGEVVFRKTGETLGGEDQDATITEIVSGTVKVDRANEPAVLVIEGQAN